MSKICLNCQEEDTSKLTGDLCNACIAAGVKIENGVVTFKSTISKDAPKKKKKKK